ncbi:hypothetical protein D5E81_24530 [Vibrio parahaemolyticus]|uniref:hypothetical protein n=1 Tax=Vibrio natriegens TaxID=691 RepID=UPI00046E9805|nr:hypothetical protein [Vibrio parahaemolyticus]EGR2708052.1 hypothetical protein [Vibrio parahaemolyticus]EGR3192423.1 hypothetical protein [Vibrio parahaemolyticus]EGR3207960.1 hypothetical protein [Vibrio parahaemolyticus]EGR3446045.1 hypothetical protein [Vibrio parahaemolyticus]
MKTAKRALRRHHLQRVKSNRKTYWGNSANISSRRLGICVSTPCVCSCWMCGNQRKHYGLSFSDQKRSLAIEN